MFMVLFFVFLVTFYVPYPVFSASGNYKVLLFDETITVLDSRTVHVSLNYKFMALLRKGYYYNTWRIYIETADAFGITVEDEYGPLSFNMSVNGNWTRLDINLRREVYGNQSYLLRIGYFAADRIQSIGPERNLRMWTVTDSVYKENVTLTVKLPKDFGVVKYEPPFLNFKEEANGTVLYGQMLGVDAETKYYLKVRFANAVALYDVTCKYTFVNKGSSTENAPEFEVPGPIDAQGQEIIQVSYSPTPISTYRDDSGNLRVKFKTSSVRPGESATVAVHYLLKITLTPAINDSLAGGLSDMPPDYKKYTVADKYWEVDDATIKSLSYNLTKDESSVLNKVKAIYDYVVKTIEYDHTKFQLRLSGQELGRYGAVKTLTLRRGVCEDISDLFIALCRASRIPAIGVSGLTYREDGMYPRTELSHAWVEVYIPGYGWLVIDPTWELFGRLEGRHIAERLEMESSEPDYVRWKAHQPFQYETNCEFRFLTAENFKPDLSVSADYYTEVPLGSASSFRLKIENHGNGTAYMTKVTIITSDHLRPLNRSSYLFDRIRGYEPKRLNLVFSTVSLGNASIGVTVEYQTESGETETRSFNFSLVITKMLTTLSCNVSSYEVIEGDTIKVTGTISPVLLGRNVTLTYAGPDDRIITRTVTTGSNGSYSDLFQPNVTGVWSVYASWEGDAEHEGSSSQSVQFNVNARPSAAEGGSKCIVATATYGSELSPQVQFLRDFRENIALRTFAGSAFMMVFNAWYYSWSPLVAASIAANPTVKAVMQVILKPLLEILQLSTVIFSLLSFSSEFAIVAAGFIASALIGLVYFVPPTTMILIAVARLRKHWAVSKYNCLKKILVTLWAASVTAVLLGELSVMPVLMMFATSVFVILTIANVTEAVSLKIVGFFEGRRSLH